MRTRSLHPIAVILLACIAAPACLYAQQNAAAAAPEVVVVFNLRSTDLTIVDHKYRVFFNKFERKNLPIEGYDLRGAVADEVMNTLAADKRFQWRVANESDKLDPAQLAEEKTRTPAMMAAAHADRVLVVDVVGFGAWISGLSGDRMEIFAVATMLDRATGRKLWKQKIFEKIPFSGDLQKLQADNQKEMRLGINSLIEKASQTLKTKVAQKG